MPSARVGFPVARLGGCAAKCSTHLVEQAIRASSRPGLHSQVVVGPETKDDAAVYKISEDQCVITSVDYGTPFCADPELFGRVAAANALSDIYAMGGRPITAVSILGVPETTAESTVLSIADGAATLCLSVNVPIVGGHSAVTMEPLFGLSVTGLCDLKHVVRNSTARPGDLIIITKPLGVGLYARAIADLGASIADAWEVCLQVNTIGATLSEAGLLSAMTDVTGYGLAGHLMEIAQASSLHANLFIDTVPMLSACKQLIQSGGVSGAGASNYRLARKAIQFAGQIPAWKRNVLFEPETNGGLLLSVQETDASSVIDMAISAGFQSAAIIGVFEQGQAGITVL